MLTRDTNKEVALWNCYWNRPDKESLTALTEYFQPYIRLVTKRMYKRYGFNEVDFDDFYQNACLGLMEAIPRYRTDFGVDFLSYASFRVRGAILNGIRYTTEKANFYSYQQSLNKERGESLTQETLSTTQSGTERLESIIIQLAYSYILDSLPEYTEQDFQEREHNKNPYKIHAVNQIRRRLINKIATLDDPEKNVIELHYFGQFKFDDIAELLGVTKGRISQIHKAALERLRVRYQQDI